MWQFPNVEIHPGETVRDAVRRAVSETVGVDVSPRCRATVVRHSVTRYRMTLEADPCLESGGEPRRVSCQAWNWVCPSQLGDYALPAAHRNIARRVLREEGQLELRFSG
jgi:ADP-ribose pyrophosphatase YjhB (NUDIX family)